MATTKHPFITEGSTTVVSENETDTQDVSVTKFSTPRTIVQRTAGANTIIFPTGLDASRYMKLSFIDTMQLRPTDYLDTNTDRNLIAENILRQPVSKNILLPLPNNITEGINHSWEDFGTGEQAMANLTNTVTGTQVAGNVSDALNAKNKIINQRVRNASNVKMYSGAGSRTFSFDYVLTPTQEDDSEVLKNLIIEIKKQISPVAEGMDLRFPNFVGMNFKNNSGEDTFLESVMQTKLFVVTDMNINYSPDGNMSLFRDGTPKQIIMSLTFSEFTPKIRGSWTGGAS